ncbi:hypothetical protein BDL97_18G041100 [Sphagnum fallax]|nr:hypothetical protein BDL97_18G041100 [Sphagnum fallax]
MISLYLNSTMVTALGLFACGHQRKFSPIFVSYIRTFFRLAIAACTEASDVLLTDGNPPVVDYIQTNIEANRGVVGDTKVSACILHWSRHQVAMPQLNYDVIVAADCTVFKDFHLDLAHTIKGLLGVSDGCQAILLSPRRGNTLDQFVKACH